MAKKCDNHRHERAKKILASSHKKGGKAEMLKNVGKKGHGGLSTAAPTSFPVSGQKPNARMDKRKRYASGGGVEGKKSAKTEVNIVIAGKGDASGAPQPSLVPIPAGAGAPVGAPVVRPPMAPPGAPVGAPPMGMRPPGAMQRGGKVNPAHEANKGDEYPIKDGSRSGEGRLEKVAAEKRKGKGRKGDD